MHTFMKVMIIVFEVIAAIVIIPIIGVFGTCVIAVPFIGIPAMIVIALYVLLCHAINKAVFKSN